MFSSLYKIRVEAGVQFQELAVPLYDVNRNNPVTGDGSSTVFYTEHSLLVDEDQDGTVDKDDVVVRVDGTAVTVSSIDAAQGKITLAAAPADQAVLDIDYVWSSHTDAQVTLYQTRANGMILGAISREYVLPVDDVTINPDFSGSAGEALLENLETVYAAGLLLKTVYTEENGGLFKEGQSKCTFAEDLLKALSDGDIKLLDTDEVELQREAVFTPKGFPNSDTDTDETYFFTRDQVL